MVGTCTECGGPLVMPSGKYTTNAVSLIDPKQITQIIAAVTQLTNRVAQEPKDKLVTEDVIPEYPFAAYLKKIAPQNFGDILKGFLVLLVFLKGCQSAGADRDPALHENHVELLKAVIDSLGGQ